MGGEFNGWPEQAFDVLLKLEGDPSVAVREECRKDRERLVRQPMVALLHDLAAADEDYEDFSVWRYATTAWWWQHQCAVIRMEGRFEIGLRFDLDGLQVGGGWGYPDSGQVERFRAAAADDDRGPALAAILEALLAKGFEQSGDVMKRTPRGYPADHPRGWLLRHRSLTAARPLGCDEWLHMPEAVDRVLAACDELRPLLSWLAEHVRSRTP